jgi:hypothetical protein
MLRCEVGLAESKFEASRIMGLQAFSAKRSVGSTATAIGKTLAARGD